MQSKSDIRINRKGLYIVELLVIWLAIPVFGQDPGNAKKQLARKIHDTVERIHAVRTRRLQLIEQHRTKMAEVERQIERIKNDIAKTNSAARKEKKLVNALKTKIRRAAKIEAKTQQTISRAAELIVPVAEKMIVRISSGIPCHKRNRQERIKHITKGLGDKSLCLKADALNNYLEFFTEELRLANSISLWNEPVLLDNGKRRVNAYQVRLGLVNQFFVSEDGRTIGLGAKQMNREWNLQTKHTQRHQLRIALDILREQRPPEVICIPITVRHQPRLRRATHGKQTADHGQAGD